MRNEEKNRPLLAMHIVGMLPLPGEIVKFGWLN